MGCMPTQEEERGRGKTTAVLLTVSAGSAVDITETADRESATERRDRPRIGEETPTAVSGLLEAATTERRDKASTIRVRRKTGGSSTAVAQDQAGTGRQEKVTEPGWEQPTTVRCLPIARRPQVFSAANSGGELPRLSRAGTLRTPPENRRARVASICLAAGTRSGAQAAEAQAASI